MRYLLIILLFACGSQNNSRPTDKPTSTIPKPPDPVIVTPVDPDLDFNWTDRRAIGMIMLASYTGPNATNPYNYVFDINNFKESLLSFANQCIENMQGMDAQAMITWDLEGQQFSHPAAYLGDPTFLSGQMEAVADEYFLRFRNKGFKVGVCLRPDSIAYNSDSTYINHYSVDDPYENLVKKIEYAVNRWGCSIFYIDSNIWPGNARVDVSAGGDGLSWWVFKRLHDKFPNVLLIPEWQDWDYFRCTAPFYSSAEGTVLLSEEHKRILPNSFLVAAVDQNSTEIEASVKQGNIMLFAAWWKDPIHERIKSAYKSNK